MKMIRILVFQIAAICLFLVASLVMGNAGEKEDETDGFVICSDAWTVEVNGDETFYEKLPAIVDMAGTKKISLKRKLEGTLPKNYHLGFYTSHTLVTVFVGNEKVYSVRPEYTAISKTPGNLWNFVDLNSEWAGQEIEIVLTDCYNNDSMLVPTFYYGAKQSVVLWYIEQKIGAFLISFLILLIGVLLVIIYLFTRKALSVRQSALWLGMFAIPLAIWTAIECHIFTFFSTEYLLLNQLTFICLKLVAIPGLKFVDSVYDIQNEKVSNILCGASIADFWLTSILQVFGVLDYRETIGITLIICVAVILYILVQTVKVVAKRRGRGLGGKRVIFLHAACLCLVSICVLVDIHHYYGRTTMDVARFSRGAFLIYIIVLAMHILNHSIELIRAGMQVGKLRMEAETDAMTKLKNRRSFESDLYGIDQEDLEQYGIVVCDLNNLKMINDVYGHSMGDYYIIISSEMIQDIFGRHGVVYRIGGDEFCAIVKDLEEEQVEVLYTEMRERLTAISGIQFEGTMQVAVGFAKFDKTKDRNLSDTVERADEYMYQNKKEMKEVALQKNL